MYKVQRAVHFIVYRFLPGDQVKTEEAGKAAKLQQKELKKINQSMFNHVATISCFSYQKIIAIGTEKLHNLLFYTEKLLIISFSQTIFHFGLPFLASYITLRLFFKLFVSFYTVFLCPSQLLCQISATPMQCLKSLNSGPHR